MQLRSRLPIIYKLVPLWLENERSSFVGENVRCWDTGPFEVFKWHSRMLIPKGKDMELTVWVLLATWTCMYYFTGILSQLYVDAKVEENVEKSKVLFQDFVCS